MSILINKNSRFIVRGITGGQGSFHTKMMLEYGTNIVAGVTPKKGGQAVEGVPVFNSVEEAMALCSGRLACPSEARGDEGEGGRPATTQNDNDTWSIHFVPAPFVKKSALEDLAAGLNLIIITEHIPVHDALAIVNFAKEKGLHVIGPNCPGVITPGEAKAGIMPAKIFQHGRVGVVSKSGTLTYEIVNHLSKNKIGQSTCVGIGGDPIVGSDYIDILKLFEEDSDTDKIVLIGEIGGNLEEAAAEYIKDHVSKPVVAYIAGRTAPPGKTMGHAGAIVSGKAGTAQSKQEALEAAGVKVAELPSEVAKILKS